MKVIIHLFLTVAILLFTQIVWSQVNDDFSDGNFTANQTWQGDTADFIVNNSKQLQLNNNEAGISFLYTEFPSTSIDNKEWRFWVKQSFSGSNNNQSRFYLSFNNSILNFDSNGAVGQGYFVQLGESGSDDAIRLFRNDNSAEVPVNFASGSAGLVASGFTLEIKITRDDIGNWKIWVDEGGNGAFQLDGSGFDDTYNTSTIVGMTCKYTASNSSKFYFDNLYFGNEIVDEIAPEVTAVTIVDATHLDIQFTENILLPDASDFDVDGLTVNSISLDYLSAQVVHLSFSNPFEEEQNYTLNISGVKDYSENVMFPDSWPFLWIPLLIAQYGDVIFSEIMFDPTPSAGLPEKEYLEIYNTTALTFTTENWMLTNSGNIKMLPILEIGPYEYVILCNQNNVELFEEMGNVVGITSFTALSNNGDDLALYNADSIELDALDYLPSWHHLPQAFNGGISLELINPFGGCNTADNWKSSEAEIGGTPGSQNSIFNDELDLQAPQWMDISVVDEVSVLLSFDEAIFEPSLDQNSFSVSQPLGITTVQLTSAPNEVLITFSEEMDVGSDYEMTVVSVSDCMGNFMVAESRHFSFLRPTAPGQVVINEIMADPDEALLSPNAEFIELFNPSDIDMDLSGVTLNEGVLPPYIIEANSYVILCDEEDLDKFQLFEQVLGVADFPNLTNSGLMLTLQLDNLILDKLTYTDRWYRDEFKNDGGWSLERIDPSLPCADLWNWRASNSNFGATPGQVNSVFGWQIAAPKPEAIFAFWIDEGNYEVEFPVSLKDPWNGTVRYVESGDGSEVNMSPDQIILSANQPMRIHISGNPVPENSKYSLEFTDVESCYGDLSDSQICIHDVSSLDEQNLVINELLFDPVVGGADYLEVYNLSLGSVLLSDWSVSFKEHDILKDQCLLHPEKLLLCNEQYMCLTRAPSFQINHYPGAKHNILRQDALPNFPNGGGVISLILGDEVKDSFTYSSDLHTNILNTTKGISLERIHPLMETNQSSSWHSAGSSVNYGTPGYQNSQFSILNAFEGEIIVENQLFSPNEDGYRDYCLIRYAFNEPGLVGNVVIYDLEGRLIRRLANNILLSTSGYFQWDGSTEKHQQSAMGSYIIYFKAFSPGGDILDKKMSVFLIEK